MRSVVIECILYNRFKRFSLSVHASITITFFTIRHETWRSMVVDNLLILRILLPRITEFRLCTMNQSWLHPITSWTNGFFHLFNLSSCSLNKKCLVSLWQSWNNYSKTIVDFKNVIIVPWKFLKLSRKNCSRNLPCFFISLSLVYCCSTFGDIHWSTYKLVCQVKQEKNQGNYLFDVYALTMYLVCRLNVGEKPDTILLIFISFSGWIWQRR